MVPWYKNLLKVRIFLACNFCDFKNDLKYEANACAVTPVTEKNVDIHLL